MKTNIELADELGVSERHFYRLIRDSDFTAKTLWHDNYVMSKFSSLLFLADDLNYLAFELEKGAPEQYEQVRNFTISLIDWAFVDGEWFEAKLREVASKSEEV